MDEKPLNCTLKKGGFGISSAVHWLGHGSFIVMEQVRFLVGELRSHKPQSTDKKKTKTTTKEVLSIKRDKHKSENITHPRRTAVST